LISIFNTHKKDDCGIELRKFNVACLSLLLGGVRTEFSEQLVHERGDKAVLKLDPNNPFLNVTSF
jgi:hypothetical protein